MAEELCRSPGCAPSACSRLVSTGSQLPSGITSSSITNNSLIIYREAACINGLNIYIAVLEGRCAAGVFACLDVILYPGRPSYLRAPIRGTGSGFGCVRMLISGLYSCLSFRFCFVLRLMMELYVSSKIYFAVGFVSLFAAHIKVYIYIMLSNECMISDCL